MTPIKRTRTIWLILAMACVGVVAVSWLALRAPLQKFAMPTADINFAASEESNRPRRFITLDAPQPLRAQSWNRADESRRFHLQFTPTPRMDETPHAIYIPHLGSDTQIFVNHGYSGKGETRAFTGLGWGAERIYYEIPRFQFLPGRNRIDVYVDADPNRVGLGPIYLGPAERLSEEYARDRAWDKMLPDLHNGLSVSALILILMALSFAPRRRDLYLLFFLALGYFALGFGGLTTALSAAAPVFMMAAAVGLVLSLRRRDTLTIGLVFALGCALTGPFLVLWRAWSPLPGMDPAIGLFAILIGPLPLLLIWPIAALTKRIVARRSRVQALESQLDDTQSVLESEIRRRAVFEERERLTRDIHDGVGGQLLGLLLRLRTGELQREDIARDLQAGLNDLRLVVDALDHTGNDLGRALSAFQDRAENSLDAAGISLRWNQADELNYEPRSQNTVLNLYRLLQEAFSNIVRHAQASTVEVEIYPEREGEALIVEIRDDGIGRAETAVPGRGTLNMQRRAQLLNGTLTEVPGINGQGHGLLLRLSKISKLAKPVADDVLTSQNAKA